MLENEPNAMQHAKKIGTLVLFSVDLPKNIEHSDLPNFASMLLGE